MLKKKIWANFRRIIELFTQKNVTKLSKYGFGIRDQRSGIRKKPIPVPGSRIQGSKRHWIPNPGSATLNCMQEDAKKPVLCPGSRIQGSKRHWIPNPGSATLNCMQEDAKKPVLWIRFRIDLGRLDESRRGKK